MKKMVIVLILFCSLFLIVGCEDKPKNVLGGWETVTGGEQVKMSDEVLKLFNDAKSDYGDLSIEPVALLAEQVVAGKNYMFLVREYPNANKKRVMYKIVIIYNDLKNKSTITHVKSFDYTKYVNENFENKSDSVVGGWTINMPNSGANLDEHIQSSFDNATSQLIKLTGIIYVPIATLGKQVVSGTNYAIICYGKLDGQDSSEGIYLLTLHDDVNGTSEIVSQAYVDVSSFNK